MKHFAKYLLGGLVVIASCSEEDLMRRSDTEYYPLQIGFYQIYSVEENIYTELDPPEFLTYELKTEIVDSFANQDGGYTYVIYRSVRNSESEPWEFTGSWSARVNDYEAVTNEGNVSFVSISFPVLRNKEWNGNALNSIGEDFYFIESAGGSYSLDGSQEFDDALVIEQQNELNELQRDQREEVYARNVGLIYKKSVVVNYCDDAECFGQEIIKNGVEYWQVLKEYGQN